MAEELKSLSVISRHKAKLENDNFCNREMRVSAVHMLKRHHQKAPKPEVVCPGHEGQGFFNVPRR